MADDRTIEDLRAAKLQELQNQAAPDTTESGPDEPIQIDSAEQLSSIVDEFEVVLADFYADWCGPCQMLEPVVSGIATETAATVAKVDVDRHQRLASDFNVQGVPTLILFADGDPVERLVGMQQYDQLADLIDQYRT